MERGSYASSVSFSANDEVESYLPLLFLLAGSRIPAALADWEEQVRIWCGDYTKANQSDLIKTNVGMSVYVFDLSAERLVLAYGISTRQKERRDVSRMKGYPDVTIGVMTAMGDAAFVADRGHFLGHASGGVLHINLFPQRRELNRGWSSEGKMFRKMERYAAAHPGIFLYHRPIYDGGTWIPDTLEYGLLVDDVRWWIGNFQNK